MNQHLPRPRLSLTRQLMGLVALAFAAQAMSQPTSPSTPFARRSANASTSLNAPATSNGASSAPAFLPCAGVEVGPSIAVALGKSSVARLPVPVVRMLVGGQPSTRASVPAGGTSSSEAFGAAPAASGQAGRNDSVADVEITLLSPTELFLLGRKPGAMNLVLQSSDGRCFVRDVVVTVDSTALQAQIAELMPNETEVRVRGAESAFVLTGQVSDALRLDDIVKLAGSYGSGRRVVNLLRVASPQQVMLEVKIAEVSKSLLDRFGIDYARVFSTGLSASAYSGIFGGRPGVAGRITGSGTLSANGSAAVAGGLGAASAGVSATGSTGSATLLGIDAQQRDGLSRVLAEPNIMALSGQSASFLSGGKIYIPVPQGGTNGGITLAEREFGVRLNFSPTVLDGSKVNLKLTSEVSELVQTGAAFTAPGGAVSILPSISSRSVDTTVQLQDGQSFVVAGLIKNNMTQSVNRFPGLGDLPLLGMLFRSTEFQKDQTELIFVVTPRLVKPLQTAVLLPTDVYVAPNRAEAVFMGASEGRPQPAPVPTLPAAPALPVLPTPALNTPSNNPSQAEPALPTRASPVASTAITPVTPFTASQQP